MNSYLLFMIISAFVIFLSGVSMAYENSSFPGDKSAIREEDQPAYRKAVSRNVKWLSTVPLLSGGISQYGKAGNTELVQLLVLIAGLAAAVFFLLRINHQYKMEKDSHEDN